MASMKASRPTLPLLRTGKVSAWQATVSLAKGGHKHPPTHK